MSQQIFAAIFASVISTYFGLLILMYIVRTFLAHGLSERSDPPKFTPASSLEVEVGMSTSIAVSANQFAD